MIFQLYNHRDCIVESAFQATCAAIFRLSSFYKIMLSQHYRSVYCDLRSVYCDLWKV